MSKLIEIAEKEIGVSEQPPQSNKVKYNTWFYGKEVSGSAYAWCGAFVSWVYAQAGMPLGTIDYLKGFAGCPYAVKNVAKWGKIVTAPEAGDVVFFDWDKNGRHDHTGIFEKDLGGGFFSSIEGNTAIGNDSNGGSVMRRKRSYSMAIFVRPNVKK